MRSTAREARDIYSAENASAGLSSELDAHMYRFKKVTRTHMHDYASRHPHLTWMEIPTRTKIAIRDSVNEQLKEEGIPPVGDQLMFYQMEMSLMSWKIRTNREAKIREELEKGGEKDGS